MRQIKITIIKHISDVSEMSKINILIQESIKRIITTAAAIIIYLNNIGETTVVVDNILTPSTIITSQTFYIYLLCMDKVFLS